MKKIKEEKNKKWYVLIIMSLTIAMIFMDSSIIEIALPKIQKDLNLTTSTLMWILNSYILVFAIFLTIGGTISDIFGRVKVFYFGTIVFTLSSLLCGVFAGNILTLIIFRGLQGFGAAFMKPASSTIVNNSFKLQNRGKACSIYGLIGVSAFAIGPIIGSFLTTYFSWRYIFWINIPIGIIIIFFTFSLKINDKIIPKQKIPFLSFFLFLIAAATLVFAIQEGNVLKWNSFIILSLIFIGIISIIFYVLIDKRVKNPLINFEIFKNKNITSSIFLLFIMEFVATGESLFGMLYLQKVLNFSITLTGLLVFISVLFSIVAMPIGGILFDKKQGGPPIKLGILLVSISFVIYIIGIMKISFLFIAIGVIGMEFGMGLTFSPLILDIINSIKTEKRGIITGFSQMVMCLGATFSVAIITCIVEVINNHNLKNLKAVSIGYAYLFTLFLLLISVVFFFKKHRNHEYFD